MEKVEEKHDFKVTELSDAEFLSYLYAERDREEKLSHFQGWNNWTLAGAMATVFCAGYAFCKETVVMFWNSVIYYVGGIMAYFLAYYLVFNILSRERGVDFSKVRRMKDVIPYAQIALVFVCAISSIVFIPIVDDFNLLFWMWSCIALAYLIAVIIATKYKNKIIPSFYERDFILPWLRINTLFLGISSISFGWVGVISFKAAECGFYSEEFGLAICISAALILLYIFVKQNTEDMVLRKFDVIMDNYLYAGASKDETIREITRNRMGYGAIEACAEDLKQISLLLDEHVKDETKIDKIILSLENGGCVVKQFNTFKDEVGNMFEHQQKIMSLSVKLNDKTREILAAAPGMKNVSELNKILDRNEEIFEIVERLGEKIKKAMKMITERVEMLKKNGCKEASVSQED